MPTHAEGRCRVAIAVCFGAAVLVACRGPAPEGPDAAEPPSDVSAAPEGVGEAAVSDAPDVAAPPAPEVVPPVVTTPSPGITVRFDPPSVEIEAVCCLDAGWLEQVACGPGTREHESLVVVDARPSEIHFALLLAGFEPGTPGRWTYRDETFELVAPRGEALEILVRYRDGEGMRREVPIRRWIRDHLGRAEFPEEPWIFAGSEFAPNEEWMGEGEHYVADMTGSIIGLVTFGDEVIGFSRVLADQAAVQPPEWEVNSDEIPPVGTRVTLILRRW